MDRAADGLLTADAPTTRPGRGPTGRGGRGRAVAGLEVAVGAGVVLLGVPSASPTFALLGLLAVSLLLRREGPSSLGLVRPERFARLAWRVLALTIGWTLVTLTVTMPVLERATGQRQDVSQFAGLQGDVAMLLGMILLSWTLAAFGEELGYRGWLFTRIREVVGHDAAAVATAVVVTSVLFAWAHAEQGTVGMVVTGLDAAFWCVLRIRFGTLWAPILAHGLNNTIGLTAFYLVGPIHGLW